MKSVLVVFEVPERSHLSCRLEDLAVHPARGCCFLFNGDLYEVAQTVECLDFKGGDAELIELLGLCDDQQQFKAGMIPSIKNIGPRASSQPSLISQPEHVLLVRLKPAKRPKRPAPALRLITAAKPEPPVAELRAAAGPRSGRRKRPLPRPRR